MTSNITVVRLTTLLVRSLITTESQIIQMVPLIKIQFNPGAGGASSRLSDFKVNGTDFQKWKKQGNLNKTKV